MVMEVRADALKNARSPILTMFEGSSIELNFGRAAKVSLLISVIGLPDANVTVSRLGLLLNA